VYYTCRWSLVLKSVSEVSSFSVAVRTDGSLDCRLSACLSFVVCVILSDLLICLPSAVASESVTDTLVSWATCSHQCLSLSVVEHVAGLDRSVSDHGTRAFRL